jgi:DNA invertase Pin-like site-specific DNA recombinase
MPSYTKPLAAYVRVSRVGERDEDRLRSPDFQREAIARFADAEGFEVEWHPEELDVSGAKARRPILDAILERVRSGELGGVVVAKLDRLSRMPPRDRVALFDDVEGAGGVILSASEQLDPSTPEGRFARDVFLGVARMQWEKYAEGFQRAKAGAMERGALIGPTPFGYRRAADGSLEPHPERAPAVAEAFRRAAREGLNAAVDYLDAQGFVREAGKLQGRPLAWTTSTVRRLLASRVYLGEGRYGDELKTEVPALVKRSVWEAAQPEPAKGRRAAETFPLSGVASCGTCGQPLVGSRGGNDGRRMYRCSAALKTYKGERCPAPANVTAELLEEYVRAQLVAALAAHPGYEGGEDTTGDLAEAEDALRSAEAELDDLTADLDLRRELGADRFRKMVATARAALDEAEARFREAAVRVEGGRLDAPAAEVLAGASLEELGELLRGALADVIVARGRGPLSDRVRVIPKGAEPEPGVAA